MNLRVLIYMNPLVVDKISKQFIYDKDSGFIFTRNLIASLPTDWAFYILVPPKVSRGFFSPNHEIHLLTYNYSTSIHQNRYHFNREMLASYFPYGTDVDVIINNQPEVAANLGTFFFNQRRERPIILNFFHWIDCKESQQFGRDLSGYIWRQIDGALAADVNYFHTSFAKSLFDNELKRLGVDIDYAADFFYAKPTIFGNVPMDLPDKKIILFNHRNNETTGWREVVSACKKLREKRDDFVLWLTDDQKIEEKNSLEQLDFVIVKRIPFDNYGYVMRNAHFSVCNLKGYATWNLSVLDSYANGCFPLMRDTPLLRSLMPAHIAHYAEIGHQKNMALSPFYFGAGRLDVTPEEDLTEYMNILLNRTRDEMHQELGFLPQPVEDHTIEEKILELIQGRLDSKLPKKYDSVKLYIQENSPVLKKDWVNRFWSFHANGNFQKIRWRLLSEGIRDDIKSYETKYFV